MKIQKYIATGILAAGALLLAGLARAQTSLYSSAVNTGGTQGGEPQTWIGSGQFGSGGVTVNWTGASDIYGPGSLYYDTTETDPAADGGGSLYLKAVFNSSSDTPSFGSVCLDYNNPCYNGNPQFDASQYNAVTLDVLWDSVNSTISIDQFNTLENWNTNWFTCYSWGGGCVDSNYLEDGGCITGLEIDLDNGTCGAANGDVAVLGSFLMPENAASGWQQVRVNYNPSQGNLSGAVGIVFKKWSANTWDLATTQTAAFWIDNITFLPAPSGPPTMSLPVPAVPGLNLFNATQNGGNAYDRNEVLSTTTSGLSWMGSTSHPGAPTADFPVSYSFNLAGFPANSPGGAEAYLFLVPNAKTGDNAPDWNETNCFVLGVESTTNGSQAYVEYKTNSPAANANTPITPTYVSGPGSISTNNTNAVQSTKLLGTYTVAFTGPDNGTLTTPDSTVASWSVPAGTFDTAFQEGSTPTSYPFLVYLGGQANNNNAMNEAFVYSSFTVTGVPEAFAASEVFTGETALSSKWETSFPGGVGTSDPAAVVMVPTTALYWIGWSLPDSGFQLIDTANLSSQNWQAVTTYGAIPMYGVAKQLIGPADLQSPTTDQFFALADRVYSTNSGSLLIAFPGQIFKSGTGVTGTPTPIANNGGNWEPNGSVYVYAVDSRSNLVTSVTDGVTLYSNPSLGPGFDQISGDFAFTQGGGTGLEQTMTNGIATFNNSTDTYFEWGYNGLTLSSSTNFMVQVVDNLLESESVTNVFNSSPVQLNP
jgi:hypothetical protein